MPVVNQILKAGDDVAALHESNGVVKVLPQAEKKGAEEVILERLDRAKLDLDHYALKCLLELAVGTGIPKEKIDPYRAVYKGIHNEEFVQAELEKLVKILREQGEEYRPEKESYVKRGKNLVKVGKRIGVRDSVLLQEMEKRITNIVESEKKRILILERLDRAKLDLDHYALKCLLELGVLASIPKEKLEQSRAVFKNLHKEEFVQAELEKLVKQFREQGEFEKLTRSEKRFLVIRANNLVKTGKRLEISQDSALLEVSKCLRKIVAADRPTW